MWTHRKSSFRQLAPSIEGVVLSARHNDCFGILGNEGFKVFIQLILKLLNAEDSQSSRPSLLVFLGHGPALEFLDLLEESPRE